VEERIRPWIEAVRLSSCSTPSESKRRKRVEISFYFHSSDLYASKSTWIYI